VTVKSLLTEPYLSAFYITLKRRTNDKNTRRGDVSNATSEDESDVDDDSETTSETSNEDAERLWPDVDVLFEQDVSYCDMRHRMTECVERNVVMLNSYSSVSFLVTDVIV
jgi:hypothetical protein